MWTRRSPTASRSPSFRPPWRRPRPCSRAGDRRARPTWCAADPIPAMSRRRTSPGRPWSTGCRTTSRSASACGSAARDPGIALERSIATVTVNVARCWASRAGACVGPQGGPDPGPLVDGAPVVRTAWRQGRQWFSLWKSIENKALCRVFRAARGWRVMADRQPLAGTGCGRRRGQATAGR